MVLIFKMMRRIMMNGPTVYLTADFNMRAIVLPGSKFPEAFKLSDGK